MHCGRAAGRRSQESRTAPQPRPARGTSASAASAPARFRARAAATTNGEKPGAASPLAPPPARANPGPGWGWGGATGSESRWPGRSSVEGGSTRDANCVVLPALSLPVTLGVNQGPGRGHPASNTFAWGSCSLAGRQFRASSLAWIFTRTSLCLPVSKFTATAPSHRHQATLTKTNPYRVPAENLPVSLPCLPGGA